MTQADESTLPEVKWLTVAEVATYFRLGPVTVYRWINKGQLPAVKLGHRIYRVKETDVIAFMQKMGAEESA